MSISTPNVKVSLSQIIRSEGRDTENGYFIIIDGEEINRVNVFGTIIRRFNNKNESGRFSVLVLDDATDTLEIRLWGSDTSDRKTNMYDEIQVGHIVEVTGRLRFYQNQVYLSPDSMARKPFEWEIYRRATSFERDFKKFGIIDEGSSTDNSISETKSADDIAIEILDTLSDDVDLNSLEQITSRIGKPKEVIQSKILELHTQGQIYSPRPGLYSKMIE